MHTIPPNDVCYSILLLNAVALGGGVVFMACLGGYGSFMVVREKGVLGALGLFWVGCNPNLVALSLLQLIIPLGLVAGRC